MSYKRTYRMGNYLILFSLLAVTGCQAGSPSDTDVAVNTVIQRNSQPAKPIKGVRPMPIAKSFNGTIHYMQLEGGFYGIVTDQGVNILPINLAQKYLQDGAEIEFSGLFVKDMVTIQQWGRPFKINKIVLLKPGKTLQNSNY